MAQMTLVKSASASTGREGASVSLHEEEAPEGRGEPQNTAAEQTQAEDSASFGNLREVQPSVSGDPGLSTLTQKPRAQTTRN